MKFIIHSKRKKNTTQNQAHTLTKKIKKTNKQTKPHHKSKATNQSKTQKEKKPDFACTGKEVQPVLGPISREKIKLVPNFCRQLILPPDDSTETTLTKRCIWHSPGELL